jgi:hypothetical protein
MENQFAWQAALSSSPIVAGAPAASVMWGRCFPPGTKTVKCGGQKGSRPAAEPALILATIRRSQASGERRPVDIK